MVRIPHALYKWLFFPPIAINIINIHHSMLFKITAAALRMVDVAADDKVC